MMIKKELMEVDLVCDTANRMLCYSHALSSLEFLGIKEFCSRSTVLDLFNASFLVSQSPKIKELYSRIAVLL